jgi:hypothetical protein
MKRLIAVIALACLAIAATAVMSSAAGTDSHCAGGSVTGGGWHNVTVPAGQGCQISNATISGNVQASNAAWVEVENSNIQGNVQISNTKGNPGNGESANQICATTIGGDLQITTSAAAASWEIQPAPPDEASEDSGDCPQPGTFGNSDGGNVVHGNLQFMNNLGGQNEIEENTVGHDLQAQNNANPDCDGNSHGGNAQGQCPAGTNPGTSDQASDDFSESPGAITIGVG